MFRFRNSKPETKIQPVIGEKAVSPRFGFLRQRGAIPQEVKLDFEQAVKSDFPGATVSDIDKKVILTDYFSKDLRLLSKFTEIRILELKNNPGDISLKELTKLIKALPNLIELVIEFRHYLKGYKMLVDKSFMIALPNSLASLQLSNFIFDAKFPPLQNLTTLKLFSSSFNKVFLDSLAGCPALTTLDLSYNKLDFNNLTSIGRLRQLLELNLEYTGITSIESLINLTELLTLNLSSNEKLTSNQLKVLTNFSHLTDLNVRGCALDYWFMPTINKLLYLTSLNVSYNHPSLAKGFKFLPSSLTKLIAENSVIGDPELADLSERCPNLVELDIGGRNNTYSNVGLFYVASLKKLTSLGLYSALYITAYGLKFLATLPLLKELYLTECYMSDRALYYLSFFPSLVLVDMTLCPLTEEKVIRFKDRYPEIDLTYIDKVNNRSYYDLTIENIIYNKGGKKKSIPRDILEEAITIFLNEEEEVEILEEEEKWEEDLADFEEEDISSQEEPPHKEDIVVIKREIYDFIKAAEEDAEEIEQVRGVKINAIALELEIMQEGKRKRR